MKIMVTYWSQTGNTKKVAEAIFGALPGDKSLKRFDEVDTLDGVELTFIGFPVMQFGPPPAAKEFLAKHAEGKRVALFVTHAMLSHGNDPHQQAMLAKELEKCRASCSKSELAGLFHCQGELSRHTTDQLLATGIPQLIEFAGMRPATMGHPDEEELKQAWIFATEIMSGYGEG
jgi:flavodoxin